LGANRPTSALLHNGRSIVNTYDAIGRITSRTIKYGSTNILETDLTYVSGASGSQTALVSSYKNGSDDAYSYTYDDNGNITSITKGSASFTYVYDKANQLIRENLYYGSGNSNNATYTYTYDEWGNLLEKNRYAYTTGTVGGVLDTVTYGYTDSQWGDKLTSYNGSTITYDAMGNPTSYRGKTLTWEGKQLTELSMGTGSATVVYTYSYDENGLRTQKVLSWPYLGATETTQYFYNGSVLIGMQTGNTVMRFSYDASGNVVAVDYSTDSGSTFTTYYYVRNAQNDVVKLIDNSGNAVVEYTYDSWGKVIASTSSLTNGLKNNQPFRYRGYVYDTETQWYYLQSRYYDPTTCRFISADVLLSTGQGVIGHNAFAYCGNNPANMIDQDGNRPMPFSTMVADGGGDRCTIINLYSNSDNCDNIDSQKVFDFLNRVDYFDDASWGNILSITVQQVQDTDVAFGYWFNSLSTGANIIAGLFIKGKVGVGIGIALSLIEFTVSMFEIPTGIYSTFEITVTGTTIMDGCGVAPSSTYYVYNVRFLYVPNGNNKQPYIYVEREHFRML